MQALTQDRVAELEAARAQAMISADVEALGALLNDGLTWTHGSAKVDTKASFIEGFQQGGLRCYRLDFSDRRIELYGDTAVVTGRVDMDVEVGGERRQSANRFTTAWRWDGVSTTQLFWHSCRAS